MGEELTFAGHDSLVVSMTCSHVLQVLSYIGLSGCVCVRIQSRREAKFDLCDYCLKAFSAENSNREFHTDCQGSLMEQMQGPMLLVYCHCISVAVNA